MIGGLTTLVGVSLSALFVASLAWVRAARLRRLLADSMRSNEELRAEIQSLAAEVDERTDTIALLEASQRSQEELLANAARDARTQLVGVVGAADLLRDAADPEEIKALLDIVTTGGAGLAAMVGDVLDLTKVGSRDVTLEVMALDVRRVAAHVQETLAPLAENKGLTLTTEIDERVPAGLIGDPCRLSQILVILAENGVKFTERGRVCVEARYVGRERDQVRVAFMVRDTGIGIAPHRHASLFAPRSPASASTSSVGVGTGADLATARYLVERMGGRISVESAVGVGSTFRFDVLVGSTEAEAPATAPSPPSEPRPRRALVADDNPVNVKILEGQLERLGWDVDVAVDGQQALALSRQNAYDVIILDCLMPLMDGLEAARAMRADQEASGRRTPILALTAGTSAEDVAATRASGMDAHLNKPVTRAALEEALSRWCT